MPIYLRQETRERSMHDQDPTDSPRLAAADLTEVAGMMCGLSALAVKRGRPLPPVWALIRKAQRLGLLRRPLSSAMNSTPHPTQFPFQR